MANRSAPTDDKNVTTASRPATAKELAALDGPKIDPKDLKPVSKAKVTKKQTALGEDGKPLTNPKGKGVVRKGPLPRRRGQSTGAVPLRTFVAAAAEKNDQLAAFASWAVANKHTKNTMKRWRELLKEFQARPVGKAE